MKAIVVFPRVSNQSVYNNRLIRLPLGVLSVAHHARLAGADVTVLDERRGPETRLELERLLRAGDVLSVGFSVMTGNQIHFALELSRFVKSISDAVTIWGGVHPTLEPATTAASPWVDFVVAGEGEETFPELLQALDRGEPVAGVAGVAFVDESGAFVFTPRSSPPDMNKLVGVQYEQLPTSSYVESSTFFNFETQVIFPVETSRGCPFRCTFCTEPAMDREWRHMDIPSVMEELHRIRDAYDVRAIAFVDDLFFVDHERCQAIVEAIIESNLDIEWYANCRAEYVVKHGRQFFSRAARSGCRSLTMGAEGGTDATLRRIRKGGVTVSALLEANRVLRDVGIAPHFSSIIGYPIDQPDDVSATVALACRLLAENAQAQVSLNKLIPTPRSLILTECIEAGFRVPTTLEGWAEVLYTDASAWLVPETAELLSRLSPLCELVGMTHAGSREHDALFELLAAIAADDERMHSLFESPRSAEALDKLMGMNSAHFRRYPMFGDERSWALR